VNINNPAGVGAEARPSALAIGATPSLFARATSFRLVAPQAGAQSLVVYDLQGRAVRHLWSSGQGVTGERRVSWDGRDDSGRRLPSGRYVAAWSAAGRMARASVTLLR